MFTLSVLDDVIAFLQRPSRALIASSPFARCAVERCAEVDTKRPPEFTVQFYSASIAHTNILCHAPAAEVQDVMVVNCDSLPSNGGGPSALEVSMWWVERCLAKGVREAVVGTAVPFFCLRFADIAVDRLIIYTSADSPVEEGSSRTCIRIPRHPFALHLNRLPELRHVQLSALANTLVVEVDIRSCLRFPPSEVSTFLCSLESPLRAVRVESCSISPIKLLNKFHGSLLVLHLFRRKGFHRDPSEMSAAPHIEDEEYEEEETSFSAPPRTTVVPSSIGHHSSRLPVAVASRTGFLRPNTSTAMSQSSPVGTPVTGATRGRRARRTRLSAVAAASLVLEHLHINGSCRGSLPRWVEKCTRLRHISLNNCAFSLLDSLRPARKLTVVSLTGCRSFTNFKFFCTFPELQSLTLKDCAAQIDLSWVRRFGGALRIFCLYDARPLSPNPLIMPTSSSMRLSGIEEMNLSLRNLFTLRPLVLNVADTLRELTLFTCANLSDFLDLPALTALEKVCITYNTRMESLRWLAKSSRLSELRATQCTQLASLTGLEAMAHLSILDVTGCGRIEAIDPIASCPVLKYLDLSHCDRLRTVEVVADLSRLETLHLRNCSALGKNFEWIERCPKLRTLALPGPEWTRSAADKICSLGRRGICLT